MSPKPVNISVIKALRIAWLFIASVGLMCVVVLIAIIYLRIEYALPMYVSLPLAFVLPIGIMIVLFHYGARMWLAWAYSKVYDVHELSHVHHLSGFGGYSIDCLQQNNPHKYQLIKERFQTIAIIDDSTIPPKTGIRKSKPYQRYFFMSCVAGAAFLMIMYITSHFPQPAPLVIVIALLATVILRAYHLADRKPWMILSDRGLKLNGNFSAWNDIEDYEIIGGKWPTLGYKLHGIWQEISIKDMNISRARLNHLMHIYMQRSKQLQVTKKKG